MVLYQSPDRLNQLKELGNQSLLENNQSSYAINQSFMRFNQSDRKRSC